MIKDTKTRIQVTLEKDLVRDMDIICEKIDSTRSEFLEFAIKSFISLIIEEVKSKQGGNNNA